MVNIFRELKYIESELLERSIDKSDLLLSQRIPLFERIKMWVKTAPYKYKNKKIFLETYFNYAGVANVDAIIARKLNIKQSSVRLIRKRLSAEAVSLLGADISVRLLQGSESDLLRLDRDLTTLEKGVAVAEELFPIEIIEAIRKTTLYEQEFPLAECKKDIAFLSFFTIENIVSIMISDEFDTDKMNYIINVLNNPAHKLYKTIYRAVTSGQFTFPPNNIKNNKEA